MPGPRIGIHLLSYSRMPRAGNGRTSGLITGRQLEVGGLTKGTMGAHLNAVSTEDTAIECECITCEVAFRHHQGSRGADLDARAAGDAVGIMQADIERRGDNRVESFPEHTVAVGPDHVVTDAHTLRAIDTLIGITQDEAMRQINLIVMVVAGFAIMEAIIRQAVLDAIPLQVTLACSRAGAL